MRISATPHTQRGATLIVGLIMLVLLTLVVTSAFMLSTGNLRAVGNMQFRDEAIAAANLAIEEVISTNFTSAPAERIIEIDIDQDKKIDYVVTVQAPVCVQGVPAPPDPSTLSGVASNVTTSSDFNTVWDIEARVSDATTGAAVTIWQGVRKRMVEPQYKASACA
jgi:Tfp pilus assembly protein PilX